MSTLQDVHEMKVIHLSIRLGLMFKRMFNLLYKNPTCRPNLFSTKNVDSKDRMMESTPCPWCVLTWNTTLYRAALK